MTLRPVELPKILRIELAPPDPAWVELFGTEANQLRAVLGEEVVAIHHAGSTSIPGLKAKPTIDVVLIVADIEKLDRYNDDMMKQGYIPRGEYGIPGRRFFVRLNGAARVCNIHAFATGHPEIERMLTFRDYLRAHPERAQVYERLKEELARKFPDDIDKYAAGKSEFVAETIRLATVRRVSVSNHEC